MKILTVLEQLGLHLVAACWTDCQRNLGWKGSNSAQLQWHLAILYTHQCQPTQAQGPARKMENPLDQVRPLAAAPSPCFINISCHSLLARWLKRLKRSKTSPNGPKSSAACCFLNCISALIAEEQMAHEFHLLGLYILFSPSKSWILPKRWFTSISWARIPLGS